jgi:hypothetical protein
MKLALAYSAIDRSALAGPGPARLARLAWGLLVLRGLAGLGRTGT